MLQNFRMEFCLKCGEILGSDFKADSNMTQFIFVDQVALTFPGEC